MLVLFVVAMALLRGWLGAMWQTGEDRAHRLFGEAAGMERQDVLPSRAEHP